jgi:trigger factor
MQAYRDNAEAMSQIHSLVMEDQAVDWLLDRAKVTEKPSTFKELMNFGSA